MREGRVHCKMGMFVFLSWPFQTLSLFILTWKIFPQKFNKYMLLNQLAVGHGQMAFIPGPTLCLLKFMWAMSGHDRWVRDVIDIPPQIEPRT